MSPLHFETATRNLARQLPRRAAINQIAVGAAAGLLTSVGRALAQGATPTPPTPPPAFFVLRRYQLKAGNSMDELVTLVNNGFVPIINKIEGFKEYLLVDNGSGAHMSVSIFADRSGAEASTREAAEWAAANVAQLIEGPPEVAEGWVRIHVTAAETTESV